MRVALVNPPWRFEGSIYFGCREPHLPLELGCCRVLLEAAGHEVLLLDGHLEGRTDADLAEAVAVFAPGMTVVTTAPSYLFWRCAQAGTARAPHHARRHRASRRDDGGGWPARLVHAGPGTAQARLRRRGAGGVRGGGAGLGQWRAARHRTRHRGFGKWRTAPVRRPAKHRVHHPTRAALAGCLGAAPPPPPPPLRPPPRGARCRGGGVPRLPLHLHVLREDRFPRQIPQAGPGPLLAEIDALVAQGVTYLYFIDEIFLPRADLLEALVVRPVQFGIQTRIDLWKPELLALLGRAGCVSIEAGVESLTVDGRAALDKRCKMTTDELADRLITARQHVPFVQANLIETAADEAELVRSWRARLQEAGVWANDPVPLYPYPSSPDYRKLFGAPDDEAWERAHRHYLAQFTRFSDIQEEVPVALPELEAACC